jgi:hypothetical protein
LAPVTDPTDIMLRYEFGKSRGAIHLHGLGFTQSEMDQRLDETLSQWGLTVIGRGRERLMLNVGGGYCVTFGDAMRSPKEAIVDRSS